MNISKKHILKLLREAPMEYNSPDRPHPDYERKLQSQDTPFKKVPFPSTGRDGVNFQELLGSESFRDVIAKYKRYNGEDEIVNHNSIMPIYQKLSSVLSTISRLEQPHITELEELSVSLVKQHFSIPEGVLNFDVKIVQNPSDIDNSNFKHDEENEENPDEPEIDTPQIEIDDDALLKLEKSKRRLVNATLQGASRVGQYMFHLVEPELTEILGNPNVPTLYGQMMSMNDINYWLFPDQMIKQASKEGPQAGNEEVDRNTNPPTIFARGINFPVLVHELIKGLMEFFALQPQGEGDENYYDKVRSEDTITKEDWDLRLGPAIWTRLRNLLPDQLHTDEQIELQNYVLNHIFNLPAKQYLLLMREVMGQTDKGKRILEKITNEMADLYNDINNKTYKEPEQSEYNDNDEYQDYEDDEDGGLPYANPNDDGVDDDEIQNIVKKYTRPKNDNDSADDAIDRYLKSKQTDPDSHKWN